MEMNFKVFLKKFVIGDIHGEWGTIARHVIQFDVDVEKAREMNLMNVGYIQVGDFGIGFDTLEKDARRLTELNQVLKDHLAYLYIIRGNHDNPAWFKADRFKEIKENLDHIMFVPDYTVLNLDLEDILFIGGAISIDRLPLRFIKEYQAWFPDEMFRFDEDKLKEIKGVDRLIMHTTPDFCAPTEFGQVVYHYTPTDPDLLQDLRAERARVTQAFNILTENPEGLGKRNPIKGLYYGHFHRNYYMLHDDCEFVCLGVNTIRRM